jgi:hypothetical protein
MDANREHQNFGINLSVSSLKSKIASHWSEIETDIKSTGLHGLMKSREVQGFTKCDM